MRRRAWVHLNQRTSVNTTKISRMTIREAEDAIRRRFAASHFRGELKYDPSKVIETERWWYIPYCWIGCAGFIVSKHNLYVNWLGSGCTLEECFWGHDYGVFCDLVDFTFASETSRTSVVNLVAKFKHVHPAANGRIPSQPVWYRPNEIEEAVTRQFPSFKRHFVWFCIPELKRASECEGLSFSSTLSAQFELPTRIDNRDSFF